MDQEKRAYTDSAPNEYACRGGGRRNGRRLGQRGDNRAPADKPGPDKDGDQLGRGVCDFRPQDSGGDNEGDADEPEIPEVNKAGIEVR